MSVRTEAIFDALLGGSLADELEPSLAELDSAELRDLMCFACCAEAEVRGVCADRGDEISRMLDGHGRRTPPAQCRFITPESPTCLLQLSMATSH